MHVKTHWSLISRFDLNEAHIVFSFFFFFLQIRLCFRFKLCTRSWTSVMFSQSAAPRIIWSTRPKEAMYVSPFLSFLFFLSLSQLELLWLFSHATFMCSSVNPSVCLPLAEGFISKVQRIRVTSFFQPRSNITYFPFMNNSLCCYL